MLTLNCLVIVLVLHVSYSFVLLDLPLQSNVVKYNGDKSTYRSSNSYYSSVNSSSTAPLIDYMRTLYEQEKQMLKPMDYNLIRALAPRIGKISFMSLMCVI